MNTMLVGIEYIGVVNTFEVNGGSDQEPRLEIMEMRKDYETGEILDKRGYKIERLDFGEMTEILVYKTKDEVQRLYESVYYSTEEKYVVGDESILLVIASHILQHRNIALTKG